MRKELTHVTNMLPYIPYAASKGETIAPSKSFTISRCKGIPQTSSPIDAGFFLSRLTRMEELMRARR